VSRVLEGVSAVISEEQKRGFFPSLFHNSEVESKLEDVKRKLENALKQFQVFVSSIIRRYVLLMDTDR
jgi:hypothetical protein